MCNYHYHDNGGIVGIGEKSFTLLEFFTLENNFTVTEQTHLESINKAGVMLHLRKESSLFQTTVLLTKILSDFYFSSCHKIQFCLVWYPKNYIYIYIYIYI